MDAYSLKYTAMNKPKGAATSIAIRLVIKVALARGRIPNFDIAGCHSVLVKKSELVLFDDGQGVIEPALFVQGDVTENGMTFPCDWMVPVLENPQAKY